MKEFKFLMIVNILCVSAMMAFLSVVGPIIRALNLQEWHAGVTVSIAGILWVILSRFWGKKSDKIGRKPILFMGVLGVAIGYFLLAIFVNSAIDSPPSVLISFVILILTRAIIGAFYSAITPVSNALVADEIDEKHRTSYIAKLGASNGLGMVLGPAAGGFLAIYGLAAPLYTFAILPLIAAFLILIFIPKVKVSETKEPSYLKIFDKRLRVPMLAAFLTMSVVITSQVCLGFFVIDRLNMELIQSAKVTGYILSIIGIVFIVSQIFVSRLKDITPTQWLKYGSVFAVIGYLIVSFSQNQWVLGSGFCIGTFGLGFIFPAFQTLAVNLVSKEEKGAASGTVSAAQGLGMIVGPLLSTFLYKLNPMAPFLLSAFVFVILFFVSVKELKRVP
ncbi:MFS transporter [Halarcobacter ebronensis]|uniref:MFS transporter n=1 Tax=Halarcobacter ebronensis TaxID=1462615 RepID=A0A4Q1AYG7_9BACT|nr:MFS transporter [Halarcobacter ebronensis]QKF82726.1 major facilitator superfamily transporter [Halarcobacter ebronensis]RXK06751.1 MFS transporter [Halarcobacter ebronensis]